MNNGDKAAHPHNDNTRNTFGLTKREYFAAHIMANIAWNGTDRLQGMHNAHCAEEAVALADALLKALEE